ncbi:uncharacterized protein LOC117106066, partial [Anneissia japonica]|uniref:uncharacterized protein LOC117106066 n=1 Tax=Anneissia japonica TaxID=1529436 RepID=UPI001425BB20
NASNLVSCLQVLNSSLVVVVCTCVLLNVIFLATFYWKNIEENELMENKNLNGGNLNADQRLWSLKNDASSGLMIFTIATTFCDRISLYGFYPFHIGPHGDSLPYHYYDRGTWKGVHNLESEYQ